MIVDDHNIRLAVLERVKDSLSTYEKELVRRGLFQIYKTATGSYRISL